MAVLPVMVAAANALGYGLRRLSHEAHRAAAQASPVLLLVVCGYKVPPTWESDWN